MAQLLAEELPPSYPLKTAMKTLKDGLNVVLFVALTSFIGFSLLQLGVHFWSLYSP